MREHYTHVPPNQLHLAAKNCQLLLERLDRFLDDDTQDTAVDESQDTRARESQETGTEEPTALVPLPGFPAYERYDYPGKGCLDWAKGPKESRPSAGASDRARACPNEHPWGVIWVGSARKSCPGCGQQMPKPVGSKSEPVAVWDIPCEVGNDGKAIKGTGFAIQIKDTGRMSNLSKQGPKDTAKDARASRHYNGMAARLKLMLTEQGLTEEEAQYQARFPFQWKDGNAKAALQYRLEAWYAHEEPDTESTAVPNDDPNNPFMDLTISSQDSDQFSLPSNLSCNDAESASGDNDDDSEVNFSDSDDVTHGPFRHDIIFRQMPSNWEKKGGISRVWWITREQKNIMWRNALMESDLLSITTNRIPNFLYHLVPMFARWTSLEMDLCLTWHVRSIYTASQWYKKRNRANFQALIKLLFSEAVRWKELFAIDDSDDEDDDEDDSSDEDDGNDEDGDDD